MILFFKDIYSKTPYYIRNRTLIYRHVGQNRSRTRSFDRTGFCITDIYIYIYIIDSLLLMIPLCTTIIYIIK